MRKRDRKETCDMQEEKSLALNDCQIHMVKLVLVDYLRTLTPQGTVIIIFVCAWGRQSRASGGLVCERCVTAHARISHRRAVLRKVRVSSGAELNSSHSC